MLARTQLDTPAAYDAAEREAMIELPNRIIEAAQPIAFAIVGYPTRINDVRELWRYADVMHECEAKECLEQIGLTKAEFTLVRHVTEKVVKLTRKLGHEVVPCSSLIRAVPTFRAIKQAYPEGCRVFELGAGSGYVGALLQAAGYQYTCSDVAQAFAIWQMHLLGSNAVIPWWQWMAEGGPEVEVFTANHMLNEVHPHALRHIARQALRMVKGAFMVEAFGSTVIRTAEDTLKELMDLGVEITPIGPGLDWGNRVVGWDDMVKWWEKDYGGIPKTADETFLKVVCGNP